MSNFWGAVHLPEHLSWDEYSFKKGKMSFIAQDYDTRKILAILDGRTQATIRNHFLRYSRRVRSRVKVITMDMFSPYYDEGYSFGWFCIQKNSARTTENTLRYEVRGQRKILESTRQHLKCAITRSMTTRW